MWYGRDFYPRSRPRQVQGGIKAQSKRGSFGDSWWAKRWIAVLESFNIGARLGRGRSYARNGQVLAIDVDKGLVKAKVQGSRPTPYAITLRVQVLTPADWKKLVQALADQALYVAKLLAGEMPQDIETVFKGVDLSLFPAKLHDLNTDCSCPDWSNPCKHIAAVYYLLGEEFDRDPFLIFKLRGLVREELLAQLGNVEATPGKKSRKSAASPEDVTPEQADPPAKGTRGKKPRKSAVTQDDLEQIEQPGQAKALRGKKPRKSAATEVGPEQTTEPLPLDPAVFWSTPSLPEGFFGDVHLPPASAALPRRLGSFPFWRGNDRFLDALEPIYRAAAQRGLDVVAGDIPAIEERNPSPSRKRKLS